MALTPELIRELRSLLDTERHLALSVLVDGAPYVGLLPYVFDAEHGGLLVHASRLAHHTRGMDAGAPFGALIHGTVFPEADPLQVPRLGMQGTVEHLERDGPDYVAARGLYLRRFPTSETTFSLGDFDLYRLRPNKGRWVGGFAQARSLGARDLREVAGA